MPPNFWLHLPMSFDLFILTVLTPICQRTSGVCSLVPASALVLRVAAFSISCRGSCWRPVAFHIPFWRREGLEGCGAPSNAANVRARGMGTPTPPSRVPGSAGGQRAGFRRLLDKIKRHRGVIGVRLPRFESASASCSCVLLGRLISCCCLSILCKMGMVMMGMVVHTSLTGLPRAISQHRESPSLSRAWCRTGVQTSVEV